MNIFEVCCRYYFGKKLNCGDDFRWGPSLEAGKWHELKFYIKVNSPSTIRRTRLPTQCIVRYLCSDTANICVQLVPTVLSLVDAVFFL